MLDAKRAQEFFAPQVEHDGKTMYGLGLPFDINENGTVRSYSKDGRGASGIVRHYLEDELSVVVLSNNIDGRGRSCGRSPGGWVAITPGGHIDAFRPLTIKYAHKPKTSGNMQYLLSE